MVLSIEPFSQTAPTPVLGGALLPPPLPLKALLPIGGGAYMAQDDPHDAPILLSYASFGGGGGFLGTSLPGGFGAQAVRRHWH